MRGGSFGLAEPSVGFGFGDAVQEVVADQGEAVAFGGVGSQQRAAEAAVFVDAGGGVGAAAVADGDLAAFELAEEFGPFFVAGDAIFRAGTFRPTPGDQRAVPVDDLFGYTAL